MARAREIYFLVVSMVVVSLSIGGRRAESQVHHVVGGDHGWDSASDLKLWSSTRRFRVGDNIWFTYSAAQESISELRTKQEFESCDSSNPIKMYTDGINKVGLDGEGSRYFVSNKLENCKNGGKLHIEVLSESELQRQTTTMSTLTVQVAAGPLPSCAFSLPGVSILLWSGLAIACCMG